MRKILDLKDVNLTIGSKQILKNINFNINSGDFILLLGPNGSGKTTLLKTCLGIIKIREGSVLFYGDKIQNIRKKCGYVPQRLDIDKYFPVLSKDVIEFGSPDKELLFHLTEEFKIKEIIKKPFGLLSGGERQKILLTMALSRKPEILFLDEPNLNLDINAYKDFLKCVEKAKKEFNLTVIMVTHLISTIPESVNKVFVLKEGRIIIKEEPEKIFKRKNLVELIYG